MRYLAIDYGLRRVGLALCDANEIIVSPLCQIEVIKTRPQKLFEQIKQIVGENQIDEIVVGLPLNMDQTEGGQAKLTRQFADKLAKEVSLPMHLQDERLSSAAADEMLAGAGLSSKKRKSKRDMLAACDILRDFLEKQ